MKITIMSSYLSQGGAERVVCNLANYLYSKGHDVTITVTRDTPNANNLDERVRVVNFDTKKKIKPLFLEKIIKYFKMRKFLKKDRSDVTLCMLSSQIKWYLKYSKNKGGKFIFSERAAPEAYSKKVQLMRKKAATIADGIVFQTEFAKKWYGTEGEKKGIVIPNAVNIEFINNVKPKEKKNEIVAIGRIEKEKNFSMLIRAFAKIKDKISDYFLVIYGKGGLLEDIKKEAVELGVADKIFFPGFVNNSQEKLSEAKLFVLSSDFEGMPNALIEAMAVGLPSIATDCPVGGPAYLIEDGVNGLLTAVGDEDMLAEKMLKVILDSALQKSLGEEAKKISEKLSPKKIYSEWERFLLNTLNR